MLSDICSDFITLSQDAASIEERLQLVNSLREGVIHYASNVPPFGYPKVVTDKLEELANSVLSIGIPTPQTSDIWSVKMSRLFMGAHCTQIFYDCIPSPTTEHADLEKRYYQLIVTV